MRKSEGFTLIELMIVVAIIGILAAIAIPNFLKFQCKSKQSEAKTNLSGIFTAEKAFFGEYNTYGTDLISINWQPDGTPVYLYGWSGGINPASVTGLPSYASGNCNTFVPTVITGSGGATNRFNTGKMKDLGGIALASPSLLGVALSGASFTAAAIGDIDTDAAVQVDLWSIDNTKQLVNATNDCTS